jgi:integrase
MFTTQRVYELCHVSAKASTVLASGPPQAHLPGEDHIQSVLAAFGSASLAETGVAEDRLHAARHSFATLLNELQITDRATQGVMGWSNASQAKRYQKTNDPVLRVVADKVEQALFTS